MDKKTLRTILTIVYRVLAGLIIARFVLSWVPSLRENQLGKLVYTLTDPIVAPVDKIIPSAGGINFSLIIIWFVLSALYGFLMRKLH